MSKGGNTQRGQYQGEEEVPKPFSSSGNFHRVGGAGSWVSNLPREIVQDRVSLGRPLSSKMQSTQLFPNPQGESLTALRVVPVLHPCPQITEGGRTAPVHACSKTAKASLSPAGPFASHKQLPPPAPSSRMILPLKDPGGNLPFPQPGLGKTIPAHSPLRDSWVCLAPFPDSLPPSLPPNCLK